MEKLFTPITSGEDITIGIPCFNGEEYIDRLLTSLENQHTRAGEIIIADDGSTDGSMEIAQSFSHVTCLPNRINRGLAVTRNTLFHKSQTPIIAFLDVDTIVPPDFVEKLVTLYRLYPSAAGIGGQACEQNIQSPYDVYRRDHMSQGFGESPVWPAPMLWGVCSTYRTEILHALGGFDQRFRTNAEDVEFGLRCQNSHYPLLYHPMLSVAHMKTDSKNSLNCAAYRWIFWGVKALLLHKRRVLPGLMKRFAVEGFSIIRESDNTYRHLRWETLQFKLQAFFDAQYLKLHQPRV